jgi:hypothetical protein
MEAALKGSLDYVMGEINPENTGEIDFFGLIPEFEIRASETIKENLRALESKDINKDLINQVVEEVGHQFRNTEGPDFGALTSLSGLVLLEPAIVSVLMGTVRDSIISAIAGVVSEQPMEEKYGRAAMNAL